MDKIDQLLQKIQANEAAIFNLNSASYFDQAVQHLADFSFKGEIDKDVFYITQIEQVLRMDEKGNKVPYMLSDDEREKLYCTGKLRTIGPWEAYKSVHWSINLKTRYVIAFECTNVNLSKSPKDIYGELYSKSQTRIEGQKPIDNKKHEFSLKDNESKAAEVISKIIDIANYSKTHTISDFNFDNKINQNMAVYFGTTEDAIMDDIYKETSAPKIIKAPFTYKRIPRVLGLNDKGKTIELSEKLNRLVKVIQGVDYNELDFSELKANKQPREYKDFIVESFDNAKDAQDVFYSLIEAVNLNPPKTRDHTDPVKILSVEKHFMSNRWQTFENKTPEEAAAKKAEKAAEQYAKENTKFIVKTTKVLGKVIVWLEVWERGIVYYITNNWDHRVFEEY